MRLSCPQCHTEYEVPDAALTGRPRTLSCAACGTKWKAPAIEMAEAAPAVTEDAAFEPVYEAAPEEPEAFMGEPEDQTTPAYEPAVALSASRDNAAPAKPTAPIAATPKPAASKPNRGLGVSILLVLVLVAVLLAEHRLIGQVWPPSLRLFNALGMH